MSAITNIELQIQSFIDGEGTKAEREETEKMIAIDLQWKETYEGLMEVHRLLAGGMETMEPSMRFTKNVMDEISGLEIAKPVRLHQNPWIFRIAGGILGVMLVAIMVYMFSLLDFSSNPGSSSLALPDVALPKISWTNYIDNGTTMVLFMVCTILAFVLLDKFLFNKSKSVQ